MQILPVLQRIRERARHGDERAYFRLGRRWLLLRYPNGNRFLRIDSRKIYTPSRPSSNHLSTLTLKRGNMSLEFHVYVMKCSVSLMEVSSFRAVMTRSYCAPR